MFTLSSMLTYMFGRHRAFINGTALSLSSRSISYAQPSNVLNMVKSIIPELADDLHKGMMGRIGIVGGCKEYTGAPYYAAISALKVGADLSHVFCTEASSPVIKSYSPELIVHPILDHSNADSEIDPWLARLHTVVVGPGLGRESLNMNNTKAVIEKIKSRNLPVIVDADGLHLVTEFPDVIKGYTKAILTPNVIEFSRLFLKMTGKSVDPKEPVSDVIKLCRELGNVTIVRKGHIDIISDGNNVLVCSEEGSARRCGGQGDLLSGTMGTFAHWAYVAKDKNINNDSFQTYGPSLTSAYGACLLTRHCNRRAYRKQGRSMTTVDMIEEIHAAFDALYM